MFLAARNAVAGVAALVVAAVATAAPAQVGSATSPASASSPSPAISASKKSQDPGPLGRVYSTVELRHHWNSFYGADGHRSYSEPSMHARLQVGTLLYDGAVDAYATLGAVKEPHSQQMLQRRPEGEVDLYPWKTDLFTLLQYNLVKFPIKNQDAGQAPEDEKDDYSASTVYIIGLAPSVKVPLVTGASRLDFKAGMDGWTKMYSRKQYTGDYNQIENDNTDDEHMTLTAPTKGAGEPIEDYAMHYQAQALTGLAFTPAYVKALKGEATVHYDTRFDPHYTRDLNDNVTYKYGADRFSYYRIRLHYDLTDRVSVTDDFYSFFDRFFAAERRGSGDEWRYRNIARLTCRL